MGASNDNLEEVLKTNHQNICGIKIFMGSSTGNMLVDKEAVLESLFSRVSMLIATHCEDELTVRTNMARFKEQYGEDIPIEAHPLIRSEEACFLSSSLAVSLAKKYQSRLHILHISTERETHLFDNTLPLEKKHITAEACIHHLWFSDEDYEELGAKIKWNPSVKSKNDKEGLMEALLNNKLDIIATDHAPHLMNEKKGNYFKSMSGGPLVQHALPAMLELFQLSKISLEKIVEKMCHHVAEAYRIKDRGYIREGYYADMVLVDLNQEWVVNSQNILYKCQWSPFENQCFKSKIINTFVNGNLVFENGKFQEQHIGKRLAFSKIR